MTGAEKVAEQIGSKIGQAKVYDTVRGNQAKRGGGMEIQKLLRWQNKPGLSRLFDDNLAM